MLSTSAPPPNSPLTFPKRGEIWLVDFNPTRGAEIQKQRPSSCQLRCRGPAPIKLVAPITGWKPAFAASYWHVHLLADATNGLTKESAVDALQLRGMDVGRFIQRLGRLAPATLEEIAAAIAAVVEYQ